MPVLFALPSVPGGAHCECQSGLRVGPGVALWDSVASYPPRGKKERGEAELHAV